MLCCAGKTTRPDATILSRPRSACSFWQIFGPRQLSKLQMQRVVKPVSQMMQKRREMVREVIEL